MDTRVWHKVEDKTGAVLALTGDTLHKLSFSGKNARNQAAAAVTAISSGTDPATIVASSTKTVPLRAIERVEVSHGHDSVKFHTVEAGKPVSVDFGVRTGDDGPGIARSVVERAGIKHPERPENIGVVEALLGPVILGLIAGVVWWFVYNTAITLETGQDVSVTQGSRRGRSFKAMLLFTADLLGTKGTIALGALLAVIFLGWAVKEVVKRPQKLVWGPSKT